jgi:hypothetical protein
MEKLLVFDRISASSGEICYRGHIWDTHFVTLTVRVVAIRFGRER